MLKVLDEVKAEHTTSFAYSDEKIASNMYDVSCPYSQRALAGMKAEEQAKNSEKNKWLLEQTSHVKDVSVLDFDHIKIKLGNGKTSCDAMFYRFAANSTDLHYLAEFKNVDKKTILKLMKDNASADSIYRKVRDSVQMIRFELEFQGNVEHDEIVSHMHFFLVYGGKNNMPVRNPVKMPGRAKVNRDISGKQKSAGRMHIDSDKRENETYERFGNSIAALGLAACDEGVFPGEALPRTKKFVKGGEKVRQFSVFSARDFAKIVDAGFFDTWDWGTYHTYF